MSISMFGVTKTFVPLGWFARKQGPVSHSSSEAEIVSMELATRTEGIPTLNFWETVVQMFTNTVPEFKPEETLCNNR